jgi:hypothetical protein
MPVSSPTTTNYDWVTYAPVESWMIVDLDQASTATGINAISYQQALEKYRRQRDQLKSVRKPPVVLNDK